MTEFAKLTCFVISAVILQALLLVGQLTADSVDRSAEYYVVNILSPDVLVSDMKQVNLC